MTNDECRRVARRDYSPWVAWTPWWALASGGESRFCGQLRGRDAGISGALHSGMGRPFDIQDRSFLFATEIIDVCKPVMPPGGVVRELGRQLLRAGTSIGANMEEADAGQSKPDFISKVAVSRKEARETRYWLRLIVHADPRLQQSAAPLIDEARQLIDILTTIKLNTEANLRRDKHE